MSGFARPVVIDNGSGFCKAGFAGDAAPVAVFPSVVGWPIRDKMASMADAKEWYVGEEVEAFASRKLVTASRPVEHGVVANWDDMELVWRFAYESIPADSEEQPVLLTEALLNSNANRERAAEILFEKFNVPALCFENTAVLALAAAGLTTGCVIDSGFDMTHVVLIYEGVVQADAVKRVDIGGRQVSDYLLSLLRDAGYDLNSSAELAAVQEMKERFGFVAKDYDAEVGLAERSSDVERQYELPDGSVMTLGLQRFQCVEQLFQPSLVGMEGVGVHVAIEEAIMKCAASMRRDLLTNIVLAGGNTMFEGMAQRLKHDVRSRMSAHPAERDIPVKVYTPGYGSDYTGKLAVWLGGSMLADAEAFEARLVGRSAYEESGVSCVHRK